ncbi:MAG TPA: hypothetical protein VIJ79_16935 [Acidobacteriaceae bacterium]
MSDETVNDNAGNPPAGSSERVGFCQDCGRPLTRENVRTVGSGVFCEPCLEKRLGGAAVPPPYGASGSAGAVPAGGPVPLPPLGGNDPSPMLAGLLGLIPGVGAMYNGQYAKGFAHLVIFMLLCAMGSVNGVGWFFVLCSIGWVFYQSFEAYHTAKARREGLPLPDPFGLNNIGVQVGTQFRATASGVPPNPYANWSTNVPPPPEAGVPPGTPPAAWGSTPVQASPYAQSAPYAAPPPPPVWDTPAWTPPPADQSGQEWANMPGYPAAPVYPASAYAVPPVRRSTVPAAAAWLIGLGVVFMVFNFVPEWRFSVHKVFPFLLMAFAIWLFTRRMFATGGLAPRAEEGEAYSVRAVCFLRLPVILFTVSVLWMLEEFHVFRFGQTWPVLVIVMGVLLLVERSVGSRVLPVAAVPPVDANAASAANDGKGI